MPSRKKQYADDDGRVICNMDVEGSGHPIGRLPGIPSDAKTSQTGIEMTKAEVRSFTASALLAALVIGSVFALTWVLFTLFLTQVAFR